MSRSGVKAGVALGSPWVLFPDPTGGWRRMPNRFLLPGSPEPRPGRLTFLPRLTLEPAMARNGLFDGAWWPHSRDIAAELPDLITALGAHLGRILRVALDAAAWDDVPRSVTVNAEAVRIGWFASSPGTISLSCSLEDHC